MSVQAHPAPLVVQLNPQYRIASLISLVALLLLCIVWELWLAPVMSGGSLLVLKALPLLFPLYGIYKGSLYTMQWAAMLVLLYLMEGIVRWYSDTNSLSMYLAAAETVLSLSFYISAILYIRPAKKMAKLAKLQGR